MALSKSTIKKLEKHDDEYVILVPFNMASYSEDFSLSKDYILSHVRFTDFWGVIIRKRIVEKFKHKIDYPKYFFHIYRLLKNYDKVEDIEKDIHLGKIYVDNDPDEAKGAEIIFGEEYEF